MNLRGKHVGNKNRKLSEFVGAQNRFRAKVMANKPCELYGPRTDVIKHNIATTSDILARLIWFADM